MGKGLTRILCAMAILFAVRFSSAAMADTVVLKDGAIVDGEVTDKNKDYLVIIPSGSHGAKSYYLAENVDKVNGTDFKRFRVAENKVFSQKFRRQKGQKEPVVTLTLKSGRVVRGRLMERSGQYFRIVVDGSDAVEEILIENIAQAGQ